MRKLLVFALVLGLAAPAMAADYSLYGTVKTHLGYYYADKDYTGGNLGPDMDDSIRANGVHSDSGTLLAIGGNSTFGAKVAASDNLSGHMEFGFKNYAGELVYLRLLYGTWNFGPGKLIVGQDYTPGTFLGYSGMDGDIGFAGDANMLDGGLPYLGRQPLVELQFGGFEFALVTPHHAGLLNSTLSDSDSYLPKIEAAYVFHSPVVSIRPVAGFQTYQAKDQATDHSKVINSYLVGLGASVTLGPAYIKATVSYMQNPGNYGNVDALIGATGLLSAQANASGDVEDSKLLQGTFVVGANINPTLGVEAGVGYGHAKLDKYTDGTHPGYNDGKETALLYYLQAPITLAKGVRIIPEIGYLDRGDLKVDTFSDQSQGVLKYADVNFRIDF